MTVMRVSVVDWLTAVGAAIGIVLGLATLGGLLVRYALLPWLQTHIVTPVRETKQQVTVNGHTSATPTLLDRVDTAAGLARDLRGQVDDLVTGQAALGQMLDGHLERSTTEWGRMWDAIKELQDHHPPRRRRHDDH